MYAKKIFPSGDSVIPVEELEKYVTRNPSADLRVNDKQETGAATSIGRYLQKNRINRQTSLDDSGNIIYDFPRNPNGPDRNVIDWYGVAHNGVKTDSFIFISHQWTCPDYAVFRIYAGQYPFLTDGMEFNYIGHNTGKSASRFHLKPVFRDEYQKRYTVYSPVVNAVDGSSILIQSASGFNVRYAGARAVIASENEKRIVFNALLNGIADTTGITKVTLEKLASMESSSRFVGQLQTDGSQPNSWFIADVVRGQCVISVLEVNDVLFDTRFYCAYAFGEGNMPDVFVWESSQDKTPGKVKEIFYKSGSRWVVTSTRGEYAGDCFEEHE